MVALVCLMMLTDATRPRALRPGPFRRTTAPKIWATVSRRLSLTLSLSHFLSLSLSLSLSLVFLSQNPLANVPTCVVPADYCFGTVAQVPDPLPQRSVQALQAGLAGGAEAFRVLAEALPPTLFPGGLPPSLLDWTTWLKDALYMDLQKVGEQSAVSMAACETHTHAHTQRTGLSRCCIVARSDPIRSQGCV
jgi:hypothetical protein